MKRNIFILLNIGIIFAVVSALLMALFYVWIIPFVFSLISIFGVYRLFCFSTLQIDALSALKKEIIFWTVYYYIFGFVVIGIIMHIILAIIRQNNL